MIWKAHLYTLGFRRAVQMQLLCSKVNHVCGSRQTGNYACAPLRTIVLINRYSFRWTHEVRGPGAHHDLTFGVALPATLWVEKLVIHKMCHIYVRSINSETRVLVLMSQGKFAFTMHNVRAS